MLTQIALRNDADQLVVVDYGQPAKLPGIHEFLGPRERVLTSDTDRVACHPVGYLHQKILRHSYQQMRKSVSNLPEALRPLVAIGISPDRIQIRAPRIRSGVSQA